MAIDALILVRFSRLGGRRNLLRRSGLPALLFCLLAVGATADESWKTQEALLRDLSHCAAENFRIITSTRDRTDQYAYAAWVYDCATEEDFLVVSPLSGAPFELDRCKASLGAKFETRFVSLRAGEAAVESVLSFEPNEVNDTYLLRIHELGARRLVLSAWSSARPVLRDLDKDSRLEVVIFKDVFRVGLGGMPNWPIVIEIDGAVSIADLASFSLVAKEARLETMRRISELEAVCEKFAPEPCPVASRLEALRRQNSALESVLLEKK